MLDEALHARYPHTAEDPGARQESKPNLEERAVRFSICCASGERCEDAWSTPRAVGLGHGYSVCLHFLRKVVCCYLLWVIRETS